MSGLSLFESGIPFTVVNNGSPSAIRTLDNAGVANGVGSGSYTDRSGISARSTRPVGRNNSKSFGPLLLNPAAFVAPRGLTFGDAGRNDLNNPHRWNLDLALLKHIPIGEHMSADFRAEAFNALNNTQFRIYDPTLGFQAQNEVSCYGGDVAYYSAGGAMEQIVSPAVRFCSQSMRIGHGPSSSRSSSRFNPKGARSKRSLPSRHPDGSQIDRMKDSMGH